VKLAEAQRYQNRPPLVPQPRPEQLPLSFAQERLWFLDQLMPDSPFYNSPLALRLRGTLHQEALQRSLNELVNRHETLRTVFVTQDGRASTRILPVPDLGIPIELINLSTDAFEEQQLLNLVSKTAYTPFDLTRELPLRVTLFKLDDNDHVLLLTIHHIATDGWSFGVVTRELGVLYNALVQNRPSPLPPLPIQYVDFALWQRRWFTGEALEQQLQFWRDRLTDVPTVLQLPADQPRPPVHTLHGAIVSHRFSAELTRQLKRLSQQHGTTLFMTMLAAFAIIMNRYTGLERFIIGSPIANRHHQALESLIGFFVNTLALPVDFTEVPTFQELLQQVRQTALDAYAHQDLPFERLVGALNLERDMSRHPLFQVMLVVQNAPMEPLALTGLSLTPVDFGIQSVRFDLEVHLWEQDDALACHMIYYRDIFEEATVRRMLAHFDKVLSAVVADAGQPIHHYPLLTETETLQLLAWTQTATDYPQDQTIIALFEQQVEQTPDNLAVIFENEALSYRQLNNKANQVAHRLLVHPALKDMHNPLMAICVERSLEMVIGLLGILKAGGAYVPIDPDYPAERIAHMLVDSTAPVMLTQSRLKNRLPETQAETVYLDTSDFAAQSTGNPNIQTSADALSYVIYTSGSTGKPKGVALPQRALFNLMHWQRQVPRLSEPAVTLQFTTLSFDVSFQEIFSTWFSGGKLVLVDYETRRDVGSLLAYLAAHRIERLFVPFVMLQHLAEHFDASRHNALALQDIITAGEQLRITPAVRQLFDALPDCRLHNHYGPSETHVVTALTLPNNKSEWPELPSIGYPIPNIRIYILDTQHQPQPQGIPGELCIAGNSLARGYFNRPRLTTEKFIEMELFGRREHIYKTGDLARWLPDGNIEFLGRLDNQVKLRGYRIELGEIEAILSQHTVVKDAAAIVYEREGNQALAAYVTISGDDSIIHNLSFITNLRDWLKTHLPDYMMPTYWQVIEAMPLTSSGKIDRKALPDLGAPTVATRYIAPRNDTELQLVQIWEEILNTSPISVCANFFTLGGHSLLAIRLISHIQQRFGRQLPLATLFRSPTIAQLATQLQSDTPARRFQHIIPIQPRGELLPLYLFPGGGGNVLYFHLLAQYLSQNQPVYGMESPGLYGYSKIADSVEEHATLLLTELCQHQPSGTYRLAGHSAGGLVAFELACQLEQQGKTVHQLIILDTYVSSHLQLPEEFAKHEELNELELLWIIVQALESQLKQNEGDNTKSLNLSREDLAAQPNEESRYVMVMQRLQEHDLYAPGTPVEELKKLVKVFGAGVNNQSTYYPRYQVHCPVVLVRAQESSSEEALKYLPATSDLGWQTFCTQQVHVVYTSGTHTSMMAEPHVQTLASLLNSI
jgi:amino acid adenylation domain-containing protein